MGCRGRGRGRGGRGGRRARRQAFVLMRLPSRELAWPWVVVFVWWCLCVCACTIWRRVCDENGAQSEKLGEASHCGRVRQKVAAANVRAYTLRCHRRGERGGRYMGGPPLVVRQKASMPSKVILGPKKQRPASQNVERVEVDQSNGRFENEVGGYFFGSRVGR